MSVNEEERNQAKLERMLVTRMNALARLWDTVCHHRNDKYNVVSAKKMVDVSYTVNGLDYELTVRDTLSGRCLSSTKYQFVPGSEALPTTDGGIVFSNNKSQAQVFAESMHEFCRRVHMADAAFASTVEAAKKLLPRSA